MSILDNFAHGLLVVIAAMSRFVLGLLQGAEGFMRAMMHGAGLSIDMQNLIMIFILVMFLVGVLRLMGGRLRMTIAILLILILAHTLAGLGNAPLGGG